MNEGITFSATLFKVTRDADDEVKIALVILASDAIKVIDLPTQQELIVNVRANA